MFARKCQECGHIQAANKPYKELSLAYQHAKCRKCSSMALDYGHDGYDWLGNKIVKKTEDETE